jgi:hypothetical protein
MNHFVMPSVWELLGATLKIVVIWPNSNCLKSLFYKLYLFTFASHCRNGRFKTTTYLMKCPWNMCANHLLSVSAVGRFSTGVPRGFEWNDYVKLYISTIL